MDVGKIPRQGRETDSAPILKNKASLQHPRLSAMQSIRRSRKSFKHCGFLLICLKNQEPTFFSPVDIDPSMKIEPFAKGLSVVIQTNRVSPPIIIILLLLFLSEYT